MDVPDAAKSHRPTLAATVTGVTVPLLASLIGWALSALPAGVPGDVTANLGAAGTVLAMVVGGALGTAAGRLAQRHTWAETSHRQAVAYALQLDPDAWSEHLAELGIDPAEAAALIGADPPPPSGGSPDDPDAA